MSEPIQNDRLAALAARRAKPTATQSPTPPPTARPATVARPADTGQSGPVMRRRLPSPTRIAATGASLVSFAAMVVAMGPLTASGTETEVDATIGEDPETNAATTPEPPQVVIEVIPNYVGSDGQPLTPEELAFVANGLANPEGAQSNPADSLDESAAPDQSETPSAAAAPTPAPAAPTPSPATPSSPAPTTPTTVSAPIAAAPTTASSAGTAAPVTAPPATAAPATAAPATAPPETTPQPTPPPRSEASG